ncbi:hypothetical protein KPL71_021553 [Citrus sinensis]|uniref:Uncharacterized protein n=1 Tax=Citrus sinensis TaxID=2711 RepID=A0ACB8JHF4_CITSI|nr:hypothetical protein KPL71_021553 [Citrus sinensis]
MKETINLKNLCKPWPKEMPKDEFSTSCVFIISFVANDHISFNQLEGLSTLCFFELVDGIIGKDHLFKRNIILIKAWCYYESRILGAHHGLISAYSLETLVLYIFNLYHSTLDGLLAVMPLNIELLSLDKSLCCQMKDCAFCLALTRQIETCHVDSNDKTGDLRNKQKRHPLKVASSRSMHKLNCTSDRDVVTRTNSARDVKLPIAMGELEMEALMEDDDLDHPLTMICFNNLMYAKHYHLSAPVLLSPIMLNQQQNNNLGEATWQSLQLKSKAFIKVNASGDPMNPPMPCNAFKLSFKWRESIVRERANDSSDPSERHEPGCHEFLLREVPWLEMTTQPALDSSFWFDSFRP